MDNTPWVLPDGRIIYMRWEYVDRSQVEFHHLWTCNPDGTNQTVYYGNMHPTGVFIDAKPIPGTDKVLLIDSPGHGRREHAGFVSIVTDKQGPDDLSAKRRVNSTEYRDPYPISEDCFIAATNNGIDVLDGSGRASRLFTFQGTMHEPPPLIKRPRERIVPSRIDPSKATGTLILDNVYVGRNMEGVEKGQIKKLLVLETLPKPLNYGTGMHDFIPISHGGTFTLTSRDLVSDGRNLHGNTAPRAVGDSASRLMAMLDGTHRGAKLSRAEIEMVRNWIHVGAPYPGTSAALGTGMVWPNNLPPGYGAARREAQAAHERRCAKCHGGLPALESYSIAGDNKDGLGNTHLAYNLTRPEKSPMLLAPLARKAGGWGMQRRGADGKPVGEMVEIFQDTNDPDFRYPSHQWSGNKHLIWTNGKPGQSIAIEFAVANAAQYAITLRMTKARDYGIFQLYLDGEKLGQPVDLFSRNVEPADPITFDARPLAEGTHTLRVEAVGTNSDVSLPHRVGIHLFGLDYLVLDKE
jgi:hypothetical protein